MGQIEAFFAGIGGLEDFSMGLFNTRHEESLMSIFDRIDRIIRILNINLVNPVGDFSQWRETCYLAHLSAAGRVAP